jgi:hypothetical protein
MNGRQRWIKQGLIYCPDAGLDWLQTHAALPVVEPTGDSCRVYFSGRDGKGRAQIGFFEVDLNDLKTVKRVSSTPVLGLGPLGAFDDSGVTTSCIVDHQGHKYHYYSGWSLGVTVPFYFFVGLAISEDSGQTFQRASLSPILERNRIDPYLTASPFVLIENGTWRMWYVSATGWERTGDRIRHRYHIKYADSKDGINWNRKGIVCIDYRSAEEYALARPWVIKDGNLYKMWYSYRGDAYRIGYAESGDGISWTRKDDEVGIDVSETGWDSEMIEYPCVFDHRGTRYLFYNGNGYGETGIGAAILADE